MNAYDAMHILLLNGRPEQAENASELELERKLNISRQVCLRADYAECGQRDIGGRVAELNTIKSIESLGAKL